MPPTPEGLAFLEALTQYIDFRLTEKAPLKPADKLEPFLLRFEERFKNLLLSKEAEEESAGFKHLMGGMEAMKTGGGRTGPPPNNN